MSLSSPRSPRDSRDPDGPVRIISAFAIIGFANTILPFIILSSTYLIILYPRPVVILIETLPAVAVKLVLPHLLYNVPYRLRPAIIAGFWVLATFVSSVTPPNVDPPVRVVLVTLAASLAAATDISFLGLTRYYGRTGLAGWGIGTGLGSVVCAVIPYIFTIGRGGYLRDSIKYAYYLTAMTLLAYFIILPERPRGSPGTNTLAESHEHLFIDDTEYPSEGLLIRDPQLSSSRFRERVERNLRLFTFSTPTYTLPLLVAFVAQAIVFPGIARALRMSSAFDSFFTYSTAYGLAFQLGSFLGRTSILSVRYQRPRPLLIRLWLVVAVVVANTAFLYVSLQIVVLGLALTVGLIGGIVYINTFAAALEDSTIKSVPDREFRLGAIGVGESLGLLMGGLVGTLFSSQFCGMELGSGRRWCHDTR